MLISIWTCYFDDDPSSDYGRKTISFKSIFPAQRMTESNVKLARKLVILKFIETVSRKRSNFGFHLIFHPKYIHYSQFNYIRFRLMLTTTQTVYFAQNSNLTQTSLWAPIVLYISLNVWNREPNSYKSNNFTNFSWIYYHKFEETILRFRHCSSYSYL